MMLARALLVAAAALVLSSCAGGSALFGPSTGRVTGHLISRVCGGAYREDEAGCRTEPLNGERIIFRLSGASTTATATTDSGGAYAIDLQPGTYAIQLATPKSPSPSPALAACPCPRWHVAGPTTVSITAGKTTTADFTETIQLL